MTLKVFYLLNIIATKSKLFENLEGLLKSNLEQKVNRNEILYKLRNCSINKMNTENEKDDCYINGILEYEELNMLRKINFRIAYYDTFVANYFKEKYFPNETHKGKLTNLT